MIMKPFPYLRFAALVALATVQYLQPMRLARASPVEGEAARQDPPRHEASPEQKDDARVQFVAGNEHLRTAAFAEAVAAYRRALEHWQHPRIYYNLGVALLNLDRPVEAHEAMTEALRHGAEPLGAELHEQAANYHKLLLRQIGEIEVTCDEPGTRVSMNGKTLFKGPGSHRGPVRVGGYQVIATKAGYLPAETLVAVLPGKQARVAITMRSQADAVIERRRIERTWIPWAVAGVGGAMIAGGGAMHRQAFSMFRTADGQFADDCMMGCRDDSMPAQPSLSRMRRARWLQYTALGSYAIGSAAVVAGLALAYLNQPEVTAIERSDARTTLTVAPSVSPDSAGLWAGWTF
jgi:tetratricopeptide (TPR) repeat protein